MPYFLVKIVRYRVFFSRFHHAIARLRLNEKLLNLYILFKILIQIHLSRKFSMAISVFHYLLITISIPQHQANKTAALGIYLE